jgi:hypothetical protein
MRLGFKTGYFDGCLWANNKRTDHSDHLKELSFQISQNGRIDGYSNVS